MAGVTRRPTILLLATALAACTGTPATPGKVGATPAASRKPGPTPTASAVSPPGTPMPPGATPTPGPTPTPAPPLVLPGAVTVLNVAPLTGTRPLDATIVLDAGWIVSNNGGAVISNNGAGAIALGAGLTASSEGNPIVPDARAAIFAAGTLVSDQGGGLISDKGGAYRLAQAAGAKLGEGLPAANAVVGAIDPLTADPLPVGVDAAGKPVYAVRTDAQGRVRLHVPQALAGNLRLVALPPGGGAPLLQAYVPADAAAAARVVDEPEGQFMAMIRQALVARFVRTDLEASATEEQGLPPAAINALDRLRAAMIAAGAEAASPRRRQALYATVLDPGCSGLDLDGVMFATGHQALKADPPAPARQVLRTIFGKIEAAAAAKLARDAKAFDAKPYVALASEVRRERIGLDARVRKPTDLVEQVAVELLVGGPGTAAVEALLLDLGLDFKDAWRIEDAGRALVGAALANLVVGAAPDGRPLVEVVEAIVKAQGPAILAVVDPPGLTITPMPPPPIAFGNVTTIAGAAAGHTDGPAAGAAFNHPYGLALDETRVPPRLYVSDIDNHVVRRIMLPAGGPATVDTLLGAAGTPGDAVGPAAGARLKTPHGLALDAQGRLLICDEGNAALKRLTFDAAGQPATVEALVTGFEARMVSPDQAGGAWIYGRDGRASRLGPAPGATPVLVAGGGDGPPVGPGLAADMGQLRSILAGAPGDGAWLGMGDGQLLAVDAAGVLAPVAGGRNEAYRSGTWLGANHPPVTGLAALPDGQHLLLGSYGGLHLIELATQRSWHLSSVKGDGTTDQDGPVAGTHYKFVAGMAPAKDGSVYFVEYERHRVRRLERRP